MSRTTPRRASPLPTLILACALAAACGGDERPDDTPPARTDGKRTVVLISLDTLRPDRLGLYGGSPEVSPVLDALAGEAVVFDQAFAPSPWTLPSHATMLSGLDPFAHNMVHGGYRLQEAVPTLAEQLGAQGFVTGAFTDGGYVSGFYGFDQGFDVFDDERSVEGPNGFRRLLPGALDWLDAQGDQDAFLFLHTFDCHTPYDEVDEEILARFRERPVADGPRDWGLNWLDNFYQQRKVGVSSYVHMDQLLNDYDAGIHGVDRGVGQVLERLRASGRYDNALVIVTSDHGEAFFEHELHVGHGLSLRDTELRVPLIVKLPGGEGAGTRHDHVVGLIDVTRTALDTWGLPADPVTQGESLLPLARGGTRKLDYVVGFSQNTRILSLVRGGHKYVTFAAIDPLLAARRHLGPMTPDSWLPPVQEERYVLGQGEDAPELSYDNRADPLGLRDVLPANEQLFDRHADPGETTSLLAEQERLTTQMRTFLAGVKQQSEGLGLMAIRPGSEETGEELDPAQRRMQEALEALGYVGADAGSPGEDVDTASPTGDMPRWMTRPLQVPDKTLLREADRRVHALRARLAEGGATRPGDELTLQQAGLDYAAWVRAHPNLMARVGWRLAALEDFAERAGVEVDAEAWRAALESP